MLDGINLSAILSAVLSDKRWPKETRRNKEDVDAAAL